MTLRPPCLRMDSGHRASVPIVQASHCRPGRGTFVEKDGWELAVFLDVESLRVVVIDNACPHAGGNLSGGEVHDGVVTCPWHQWRFDLSSGICPQSTPVRVRKYRAWIENGWVYADLIGGVV